MANMDALTEWAAFAGFYSGVEHNLAAYDQHVDRLLTAIGKLSDSARAELVAALENP